MMLTIQQQACARELCIVRARVHACRPYIGRMYFWNSKTNERPRNIPQAETTGTKNQDLLNSQTLTLKEKIKQFKENFIEQTNLRWNLSYRLQITKTRKSSSKPLRRIISDRWEDDCLSKRNFMETYMWLTLHQLTCTYGLWEGRARVHACRPYIGCVYLCGSQKCSQTKKQR